MADQDDSPKDLTVVEQQPLFTVNPEWKDSWQGMPEFSHADLRPDRTMLVHFRTPADCAAFSQLVGQTIGPRTKYIWYPKAEIGIAADKMWTTGKTDAPIVPRYPVYIISKGRADTRLTAKALEQLRVPYHIVIEPQEYDQYAAVIDPTKILVLPFSNLGQGGIPARNWVWEHAKATGAERHWILDDNISGFCRFQDNLKVEVDSGITFKAIEDFVDRYENVAMAGFNYDYFAPRKNGAIIKPYTLNTRVYSGILLRNDLPHRWRGRYNEDTDLSLRILKDGWCTLLFNAFLMYKSPTLKMKGGNSDELYKGDGRKLMAESLVEQHPDCVTMEWKWNRWQHQVDYRRFAKNELRLKPGIEINEVDEYNLTISMKPEGWDGRAAAAGQTSVKAGIETPLAAKPKAAPRAKAAIQPPIPPETSPEGQAGLQEQAPGPSILDFLSQQPATQTTKQVETLTPSPAATADHPDATALKVAFETRGHSLFVKDGKLFASNASRLTEEDRLLIKQHKPALIELLTIRLPVVTVGQSHPLRSAVLQAQREWVPDTPPELDGVSDIILNFATTGLQWAQGDRPVGITVSTLDGQLTRFLPFGFQGGGNIDEAAAKRWLQEQVKHKHIINANTRFDMHQSRVWGVDLEEQGCTFSDIQHTAALLDDNRKQFRLDTLLADYLPELPVVARVDEARHSTYHAADVAERELFTARAVGRLRDVLYPQIDEQDLRAVHDLEDAIIPCVVEMEKNGAPINLDLLAQYTRDCTAKHDQLLKEIANEVGFAFSHNTTSWTRLFEALHLPPSDSYAEPVLTAIKHPLIRKAHLASQYASLNSKTFKAYVEQIGADGILRFELNQLRGEKKGTVSGRFSAGYIQQVPNYGNHAAVFGADLFPRRLYIPGPGHTYLAADAEQIQYRIFAHYANNPQIKEIYKKDPHTSFHRLIEATLRKYKPDLVYEHVKTLNFMRIFGGGLVKLGVMMGFITEAEGDEIQARRTQWSDPRLAPAREIDEIYKRELPEVEMLLKRASHTAMPACTDKCDKTDKLHKTTPHRGYVKTVLGRRSRFPNGYRIHKAFCMVDQGSEGDIVKTKIVELHKARKQTGFLMRMTVHDEVTGDAMGPETIAKVSELLNHQSFPQLSIPILWSCKEGATWADCK